jgi:HEPN domain-containing protein
MPAEKEQLDELTREIRKVILDNRKFLDRVMDDEFEPEEEDEEPAEELVEL